MHANVWTGKTNNDLSFLYEAKMIPLACFITKPTLHLISILSLSLSCHTIRKEVLWWQNSGKLMTLICSTLYIFMSSAAAAAAAADADVPGPSQSSRTGVICPRVFTLRLISRYFALRAHVQGHGSYLKNIMLGQSHLFTRSAGHSLISSIHHLLLEAGRKSNYKKKKKIRQANSFFHRYYTTVPLNFGFWSLTVMQQQITGL